MMFLVLAYLILSLMGAKQIRQQTLGMKEDLIKHYSKLVQKVMNFLI